MKSIGLAVAACFSLLYLTSGICATASGASAAHTIKECVSTDLIGQGDIYYTGPVPYGPGARWFKETPTLIVLAADVKDIFGPNVPKRIYAPVASVGGACSLSSTKKTELSADLGVDIAALPLSANLKGRLGTSVHVTATVDGFSWEAVKVDVYNDAIRKLPNDSSFKHPKAGRLTAIAMLKVRGYTATIDLTSNNELGLGANFKGPLPKRFSGEIKANASATVTADGKLVISVPGETYIAAILRPINADTGETESSGPGVRVTTKWEVHAVEVDHRP